MKRRCRLKNQESDYISKAVLNLDMARFARDTNATTDRHGNAVTTPEDYQMTHYATDEPREAQ